MKVVSAPLQLEGYYIEDLRCSVIAPDQIGRLQLMPGLHVRTPRAPRVSSYPYSLFFEAFRHEKSKNRYRLELKVFSRDDDEESLPYSFSLTLVGFFNAVGIKPKPELEPYLMRNAATILYSSARELLAAVTGRGPFPAVVLPTVIIDVDEEEKAKMIAASATKHASKKRVSRKK